MAAQAVDFTISGHVNRAIFINDSDASTSGKVRDNASSGTRIRAKGTSEMMDGGTAGVLLEYAAGGSLALRYAEVWFAGDYGKVSIGQGDQGGEGSVWKNNAAIWTGFGQDSDGVASNYYSSLDGGSGRNERLRYDTPAVGPVSAAISVGNGDEVSAGVSVSQSFGGTSFAAGIGAVHNVSNATGTHKQQETISGSAGVSLAGGISISGAWGVGSNWAGAAAVAEIPAHFRSVNVMKVVELDSDNLNPGKEELNFDAHMGNLRERIHAGAAEGADAATVADGELAKKLKAELFDMLDDQTAAGMDNLGCNPATDPGVAKPGGAPTMPPDAMCGMRMYPATPGTPAQTVDPSFFQVAVSYAFGDTSVGASWYQSNDLYHDGSKMTAVGLGVDHKLPKLGTNVYAAAQNYNWDDATAGADDDATVVMIGARVMF